MAEAFVSFLIERVEGVLKINKGNILWGANKYVKDLQTELKKMKLLLKDAEEKQKENTKLCDMIQNIIRVAFKIDDEVENYYFEVAKSRKIWFRGVVAHFKRIYYGRLKKFQLKMVIYKSHVKWYTRRLEYYGVKKVVHEKEDSAEKIDDDGIDGKKSPRRLRKWRVSLKMFEKSKFVSVYVLNEDNKVMEKAKVLVQSLERI